MFNLLYGVIYVCIVTVKHGLELTRTMVNWTVMSQRIVSQSAIPSQNIKKVVKVWSICNVVSNYIHIASYIAT